MTRNLKNIGLGIAILLSLIMHWNHLGKDLMGVHVWRQTQTQSTINSFYEEDFNILNPRRNERADTDGLFRMEFPLMQWSVAALYKLFGKHILVTRLFMFIIGMFSVLGIYRLLGLFFGNSLIPLFGAWAFSFSPSFYYYTINPMPDNLALCFAIWALVYFYKWSQSGAASSIFFGGLFFSLAALCKLPFIIYFAVPALSLVLNLFSRGRSVNKLWSELAWGFFLIPPLLWYAWVIPSWDNNIVIKGVFENEDPWTSILDYLLHNLVSTLPELLLNYAALPLFLAGLIYFFKQRLYKNSRVIPLLGLSIAAVAYYFFEINTIAKIHDYYLWPFLPLLFLIVAFGIHKLLSGKPFFKYLGILCLIILPLTAFLRMQKAWNPESPGFNKDLLVHKEELRSLVPKDALVVVGNDRSHFIFLYYIDKKGWGFDEDKLSAEQLADMIQKGAQYLYTDSQLILNDPSLEKHLQEVLWQKGSLTVYRLTP